MSVYQLSGLFLWLEDFDADALAERALPEQFLEHGLFVGGDKLGEDLEFVEVEFTDLAVADYGADGDVDGLLRG